MSDDRTRDPANRGETAEDRVNEELEIAKAIEATIGEATSIEAEMLEEAAELEEIAEAAISMAEEAVEAGEEALEAGDLEEAEELEDIAEDAIDLAGDALDAEEDVLDDVEDLEDAVSGLAGDLEAVVDHPPPADEVLGAIAERFPTVRWDGWSGQDEAHVPTDVLVDFAVAARDAGYRTFIDLCGVDHLRRVPRFEVVTHLLDADRPHRLRIRVGADANDPTVPSITGVFPGANFYEREAYDMFGIDFPGHPDLTRILMPDDWEGHPLRKDYAVGSVPVQFKGSPKAV